MYDFCFFDEYGIDMIFFRMGVKKKKKKVKLCLVIIEVIDYSCSGCYFQFILYCYCQRFFGGFLVFVGCCVVVNGRCFFYKVSGVKFIVIQIVYFNGNNS